MKRLPEKSLCDLAEDIKKARTELAELERAQWHHAESQAARVARFRAWLKEPYPSPSDWPYFYWDMEDLYCETTRSTLDWAHGECTKINCTLTFVFRKARCAGPEDTLRTDPENASASSDEASFASSDEASFASSETEDEEVGATMIRSKSYEVCRQRDHWGVTAYEDLDIVSPIDEVARGDTDESYLSALGIDDLKALSQNAYRLERLFAAFYVFLYEYHTDRPPRKEEQDYERVF